MAKVALITGVTGQDGAYLAELLLGKGYIVHGIKRRSSSFNTARIDHIYEDPHIPDLHFQIHYGDMTDSTNLIRIVQLVQPDEIYNLAAQSHVQVSFETPEYTANADATGALRILEAIRILGLTEKTRFYQASTSELYGKVRETPQTENTPFYPRSPYGVAKLYAYWITVNYREAYGLHASNGILFNHESPIRGETFVTRKITRAVAAIHLGVQKSLFIGNLHSQRDWGHARDYVEGMWRIVQQPEPDDFVLATGETHSVRDFIELAFSRVGRTIEWQGEGMDELGIDTRTGDVLVRVDPRYFRPTEVDLLLGDPSKARRVLGWHHKVTFPELVSEMVNSDLEVIAREFQLSDTFIAMSKFDITGKRVWVAGHRGMAGSAIVRRLGSENCEIITAARTELDLRRQADVNAWMADKRIDAVFMAAGTVGGILANSTRPAEFLADNLAMAANVIEAARQTGVKKLLFLGSSCIYPRMAPQPMREEMLLTGALEPTNEWYAIAKIAGIKLCQAYRRQYGCDFVSVMPTNLYGPGDRYDAEGGHVVAALIMKIHAAKVTDSPTVEIWGSGTPKREFLFSEDLADACVFVMKNYSRGDVLQRRYWPRDDDPGTGREHRAHGWLERDVYLRSDQAGRNAAQGDGCEPACSAWLDGAHRFRNRHSRGVSLVCGERRLIIRSGTTNR